MLAMKRTGLALLLTLALLNTACPKKSTVISIAENVQFAAEEFVPVAEASGISTGNIKRFLHFSSLGLVAIKADDGTAVGHYDQAVEVLKAVVIDAQIIKDPVKRTLALATIGIVNRYLHQLLDQLPAQIQVTSSQSAIAEFRAHKIWRCRDSVSGRFAKMEYCRANPATTQVEVR